AERLIGLRGQIQHFGGEAADLSESEPKRRKVREATAKLVEHRAADLIGWFEWIQPRARRALRKDRTGPETVSPRLRLPAPARQVPMQSTASSAAPFVGRANV